MSFSREGEVFPVCKNSAYASTKIMPHALPRVHSLGEKACAVSMTNSSTSHTSMIRRPVWVGDDHNFVALSVGLRTKLLEHAELSGKLQESNEVNARCC